MAAEEPPIIIRHREQLLDTLSEAAEIEHNLMCCYLYAAWSLKTEPDDGVDPELQKEIRGWQRAIVDVAIDEMTHLTLVSNLMNALGGVAHLHRPNFPVANGYHPADLQVRQSCGCRRECSGRSACGNSRPLAGWRSRRMCWIGPYSPP